MKKKLMLFSVVLLILGCFTIINLDDDVKTAKVIDYNGNNLLVTVDDKTIDTLPSSGNYYLTGYECDNTNTELVWDRTNYKLTVSNGKNGGDVSCSLTFESKPLLSDMPLGSYVDYTGAGGTVGSNKVTCNSGDNTAVESEDGVVEAINSCSGRNAHEDIDKSGYTYGYCYSSNDKYYTTGWRIAYVTDNKVKLISAGSPECNTRLSSIANETYIKIANANALKYCNSDYVDGGCACDSTVVGECDNASTDAWAISDMDFYYMTKMISGYGKRLTEYSSWLGEIGGALDENLYCHGNYSYLECGYNNDLIDSGSYYWFASQLSSSSKNGVYWSATDRVIQSTESEVAYGLRPIINLSESVYVIGGSGTMSDPYKISNS